ncbi:MAG: hypothetical protein GZ085_12010 [Sulfuriferula multivorans]|uniref:Alkylmercury lyase n=1 Tax=Sulfuriferula multivorans TaxID=1559896 RepID=A0A7C9TBR9_9PROT|nr:hypothetical protein [Sulfuriferula multivorans]
MLSQAIERLNRLLPLKARQNKLSESLKTLHQAVIQSLVMRGCPLSRSEIAEQVGEDKVDTAIARLEHDDLAVLSADRRQIVGAYPVTLEPTQHKLHVSGRTIYAMCALDALSVGPMFELPVEIRSRCRVSAESVYIKQDGMHILAAIPPSVRVGVRWQMPSGDHAAHSLCMEMVFLKDDTTAAVWHDGDLDRHGVFSLEEAVQFGAGFFRPLLV